MHAHSPCLAHLHCCVGRIPVVDARRARGVATVGRLDANDRVQDLVDPRLFEVREADLDVVPDVGEQFRIVVDHCLILLPFEETLNPFDVNLKPF